MCLYHALVNALSAHVNTIFYTHVERSPTKTIYIKYYMENTRTHTHTHTTMLHVADVNKQLF